MDRGYGEGMSDPKDPIQPLTLRSSDGPLVIVRMTAAEWAAMTSARYPLEWWDDPMATEIELEQPSFRK